MRGLITLTLLLACTMTLADEDVIPSPMALVAAAKAEIREIRPEQLAGKPAEHRVLIDVREPAEFEAGHIHGAVNQPRGTLEFAIQRHPLLAQIAAGTPADLAGTEILLYCGSGARSALAAQSLQKMGFTNVYSLAGGFRAWEAWQTDEAR